MRRNVGGMDRAIRVVLGIGLSGLALGLLLVGGDLGQTTQYVMVGVSLLVAVILFATAGTRKCPINGALSRDTFRGESRL